MPSSSVKTSWQIIRFPLETCKPAAWKQRRSRSKCHDTNCWLCYRIRPKGKQHQTKSMRYRPDGLGMRSELFGIGAISCRINEHWQHDGESASLIGNTLDIDMSAMALHNLT